ncbi:MAG: endopeptidase La [Candidatus Omnitrophica bacterium]|nr:endopeptidase La [Candidatus Omnitrophota bacterium]
MLKTNNTTKDIKTDTVPLLPLRDIVVFPDMVVPLLVGRARSIKALDETMSTDKLVFLATQKDLHVDDPMEEEIYKIGTVAEVLQHLKLPDGSVKLLVEGKFRARLKKFVVNKDFYRVQIESIEVDCKKNIEIEALMRSLKTQFEEYIKLNPKLSSELLSTVLIVEDPVKLANIVSSNLTLKIQDKQNLLEIINPKERLEAIAKIINAEIEILKVEKKIMSNIKRQIEKSQRDYFLNEQLKAIEKELGGRDGLKTEIGDFREKIAKAGLSQEAAEIAERELDKLSKMPSLSPEATVARNYIDWLVNLPWSVKTKDNLDIANAEKILNEDHYGLEKPKERILEYLAVRKLLSSPKGQILCLAGPPGVGKTSLARSVARALGRKFIRVSLGGVRDEAEIRGHRRTYIGALPGRIIQSMRKAGSKNPVFLLDEIDKMSMDFRGDPTSALLEVLDAEENKTFSDHYLEVSFDLSEVMFITTCNIQYNIPLPLQDRMEIIKIAGYTEYEKFSIARLHLFSKQIKAHGLSESNLKINDKALFDIIGRYTREAGVRELERRIAEICRKVAKEVVENNKDISIEITRKNIHKYLGPPKYLDSEANKHDEVGVATGLAWTEVGGDIMNIETSLMKGKGNLILTGKLGEVMQESAKASLTYIRSRSKELGIKNGKSLNNLDIHIHVPEGAIPKDGPSAGITMATALVSSFTKRAVKRGIAMTGEITLRGKVLPVGGIKAKFLAAHRAGIKSIIYPKENKKDIADIPKNIVRKLKLIPVENMDEVLKVALKH